MYKSTIKDVFLTTILEKRIVDSNGKHPVKLRISHKGKKAYFVIAKRLSLSSDEWDKLPKAKSISASKIKDTIQEEFTHYQSLVKSITAKGEYSHDKLRKYKEQQPTKNLTEKFITIIKELRSDGQVRSADLYLNAINSINNYSGKNLVFDDITPEWLKEYERVITDENLAYSRLKTDKDSKRKKYSISYTTLGIYLRNLRAVFNKAITDGDINESIYPFSRRKGDGKYKISKTEGTKIALTIEQLAAIEAYQPNRDGIETSRDIFLLSLHIAGLNLKDMLLLKWEDYQNDEIGFIREKTKRTNKTKGKKIIISVNAKAKELISKLSRDSKGDYILPFMIPKPTPTDVVRITKNLTKLTNKHLAIIGKELGIEGLTTYVARHTFATILKNNGTPIPFISECLGHASIPTTQAYLKSFEKEQRARYFDILSNITNNH